MSVSYFALRRLSPFHGTIQVVEAGEGRAFSLDGIRWTVQLLSQQALRQPVWGNIGPASAERRYFNFASWSSKGGMVRRPVNPSLGDQSSHPALGALLVALDTMPPIPFPLADTLELWLLHREDAMPLALLRSMKGHTPPPGVYSADWRAFPPEDRGFFSPGLLELAAGDSRHADPQQHAAQLTALVGQEAGRPRCLQWFRRDAQGGGIGLQGQRLRPELEGRFLPRTDFPELLLSEAWPEDGRILVQDYLDWQAPRLLTLPGLAHTTRRRLERAAVRRPMLLYHCRKLIPEVLEREVMEPALVQAVLRHTA